MVVWNYLIIPDPQANELALPVAVLAVMKQATGRGLGNSAIAMRVLATRRTVLATRRTAQMKMAAPVQRGQRERQPEVEVVERGSRESYKDVTRRSPWNSAIAMSALATRRTAGTKRKAMRSDGKESS